MRAELADLRESARRMKKRLVGAWRQIHIDANADVRNTVFLAGSGRGGTTWIAELINYDNAYRFIFEPFFARHVPLCRSFRNRQYLRPDNTDPQYLGPATRILSGRFRNGWADYYNRRVLADRRLVKEIRANLFLKWIHTQFPGVPIVLLFRHPLAVAASRLHHRWNNDVADFLLQEFLMADFLEPFRDLMERDEDPFATHVLQWCIENYVPLRQFRQGDIHLAFYENFSADPQAEVRRLFAYLRRPVTDDVFARIDRPSSMTWMRPGDEKPKKRELNAWRPWVSQDRVARALEILRRFDLDRVYSEAPVPDPAGADSLLQP
jgi:hypothetical protein